MLRAALDWLTLWSAVRLRRDRLSRRRSLVFRRLEKQGDRASGDSRSRALALSGQWALSKNYRVFESFRFVASVALTVIAGGGGAESGLLR